MAKSSRFRMSVWVAAAALAVAGVGIGVGAAYGDDAYVPTAIVPTAGSYAAMPKPDTTGMNPQQIAQVQRGEYLTTAADCMPCHMAPGAKPFAGGLSFKTPFGVLYSPNISSSKTDGIGGWTDQQFWHALHDGVTPGSSLVVFPRYLYPAMPYTSYSKLSKPDVLAIKAYLDAIPAVNTPNAKNAMNFPFSIRAMQLGWRLMFFRAEPVHYKKSWSAAVKNGAYIAEALGHCSECHSPRNILFAIKSDHTLAGAPILGEPWYAPNISSSKSYGVGGWSQQELVSYLHEGGNMQKGSAYGPMKAVVDYSLSQIPKSDVEDLAAYLQTATEARETAPKKVTVPASEIAAGQTLYAQNCAACHQADGKGVAGVFPNLAGNQSVWQGPADNTIGIVLGGMIPWHANGPAMPAFGAILDDHQISQIANYVRTAWGNPGQPDATAAAVYGFRKSAPPHRIAMADADYLDPPPIASAAARKLGCPLLTDPLIDPTAADTAILQGADSSDLGARTGRLIAAIHKSQPHLNGAQVKRFLLTTYCPIVATDPSISDKKGALKSFMDQSQVQAMAAAKPAKQGG